METSVQMVVDEVPDALGNMRWMQIDEQVEVQRTNVDALDSDGEGQLVPEDLG